MVYLLRRLAKCEHLNLIKGYNYEKNTNFICYMYKYCIL